MFSFGQSTMPIFELVDITAPLKAGLLEIPMEYIGSAEESLQTCMQRSNMQNVDQSSQAASQASKKTLGHC